MSHRQTKAEVAAEERLPAAGRPTLLQLGLQFLKIGAIGFGGGMAVIALMEKECVRRHHCIEAEEFLHGVGLGQILGPFASNAALFIGYRLFGLFGALTALTCFMAPSILLVIALSWVYFTFHNIPSLQGALAGLGPVVIALILGAAWSMGRKAVRFRAAALLALAACLANLARFNPIWVLLTAGLLGLVFRFAREGASRHPDQPENGDGGSVTEPGASSPACLFPVASASAPQITSIPRPIHPAVDIPAGLSAASVGMGGIFWTFLKVGFVFFGGGFVLVPILHQQLVTDLAWLSHHEFLDGVAISQLTPGPVAVLATFAGYRLGGIPGALAATFALFLPAVLLKLVIAHFYERFRRVACVQDFLAGVTPAVVGLIVSAALILAPGTIQYRKPLGLLICALSFLLLVRWKWHPAFVLMLGAAFGITLPGLLS